MCLIKYVQIKLLFYILNFSWFLLYFSKKNIIYYKIYIKQNERVYFYYFIVNIIIELIS